MKLFHFGDAKFQALQETQNTFLSLKNKRLKEYTSTRLVFSSEKEFPYAGKVSQPSKVCKTK